MPRYIYQSKSLTKNGKRYDLDELSYVFDCPTCEVILTSLFVSGAITARNVHFNTAHPELHMQTVIADAEDNVEAAYEKFQSRAERVLRSV